MSYGKCRNLEPELGLGSQEKLFLAWELPCEGALPRGVLTSRTLFEIQNLTLLGRREQDGGACNMYLIGYDSLFLFSTSSGELCLLQGDPDSKDSAAL